jgi:hypothetical protein
VTSDLFFFFFFVSAAYELHPCQGPAHGMRQLQQTAEVRSIEVPLT